MSAATTTEPPPGESKQSEEDKRLREETKQIVLESIGDMLEDAWSKPDITERKKVVKQLLLKWHPDKNTDTEEDEELATAATQHIHAEVERLEQGLPRNTANFANGTPGASGFDPRNPFSSSPTFQRYFEEAYRQHSEQMNRRRREQEEEKARRSKYTKPTYSYTGRSSYAGAGAANAGSYTSGTSYTSGAGSRYTTGSGSYSNGSNYGYTSGASYNGSSSNYGSSKYSSNGTSYTKPETSYKKPETSYKPSTSSSSYTSYSSSSSSTSAPPPSSSYFPSDDDNSVFAKVALLLRQARADLRAADNDYDVKEPAYEWVCFKSHQAAEKALKSFNLLKNNTKSFSHELASLSAISRDEELRRMATKLQELIGDSNKLYNLVFVDTELTPHQEITRELACDTMMCARDILERVQELTGITT